MTIIGSDHNQSCISTVRDFLRSLARGGKLTTYQETWEVARKCGDYSGPNDPRLWDLLGVISSSEVREGRPPISVLVTHKSGSKAGFPGVGFFTLMNSLCRYPGSDEESFSLELKATFDYWSAH